MTRAELIDKIRGIVKNVYKPVVVKVDLDTANTGVSLDIERFPLLAKFPSLREIIEKLLTSQYDIFIGDVLWVAPRPTTFKIIFNNGQVCYLIVTPKGWVVKVEGKKYFVSNLNELERASEALARILSYGNPAETTAAPEAPAEEAPAEEAPAEEAPEEAPAEEETPEETT
jgi:hypothetical protein